jgi:hypothetical protein
LGESLAGGKRMLRCFKRRTGSDVRELAGVENEPQEPADGPEARATLGMNGPVDDDQVVCRNDKGILSAGAASKEGASGKLTEGAAPLLIGPVHHR